MIQKRRFKVLSTAEVGKFVAQESGLTEREATRVFRSVNTVIRNLLLSGYGVTLGSDIYLELKPIRTRNYFHPVELKVKVKRTHWVVKLRMADLFKQLVAETLEEPTEEDMKQYKRIRRSRGQRHRHGEEP